MLPPCIAVWPEDGQVSSPNPLLAVGPRGSTAPASKPPQAAGREESLPREVSAPSCPSVVTKGHLVVTERRDGEKERKPTTPAGWVGG